MEKHRNGYPLVQIQTAKIEMLLYPVWYKRILSIHNRKNWRRCHSISQTKHGDYRKRPQNYYTLQEISPLSRRYSLEKGRIRELIWRYNWEATMALKSVNLLELIFYHSFSNLVPQEDSGLYWDDGLILLWITNGQLIDWIRKKVVKLFKEIHLKIEYETNPKIVNFLNVTFNLTNSTYRLYDNLLTI